MTPQRYKYQVRDISLLKSLKYWLQGNGWNRKEVMLVEVSPDSPEYKDAPFEVTYFTHGKVIRRDECPIMPNSRRIQ